MKKSFGLNNPSGWCLVLAALLVLTTGALRAKGRKALPLVNYNTWMVYWDHADAEKILRETPVAFEHICMFAYHFDDSHALMPADAWVSPFVPGVTAKLLMTAVNDVATQNGNLMKDPAVIDDILSTPEKMQKHVEELVQLSEKVNGIEIDYENMRASAREPFTQFIKELAGRLHQQGKYLSIVVQPKTDDTRRDGAGAIDWKEIGLHADMVKVMAYYFHYPGGEPGPLAPPDWVTDVARFALSQIPQEKVCIAFSLQGIDWPSRASGKMISHKKAALLAENYHSKIFRDRVSDSPTFSYRENNVDHMVWFEDEKSLNRKITALREMNISHIAVWYLGAGERSFWKSLSESSSIKR